MKATFLIVLITLLAGCSRVTRDSSVNPLPGVPAFESCGVRAINIRNAELFMLDSASMSNAAASVIRIALSKSGLREDASSQLTLHFTLAMEENDLVKGRESITMYFEFFYENRPFAVFIVNSRSRELIMDKGQWIAETAAVFSGLRQKQNGLNHADRK